MGEGGTLKVHRYWHKVLISSLVQIYFVQGCRSASGGGMNSNPVQSILVCFMCKHHNPIQTLSSFWKVHFLQCSGSHFFTLNNVTGLVFGLRVHTPEHFCTTGCPIKKISTKTFSRSCSRLQFTVFEFIWIQYICKFCLVYHYYNRFGRI